MNKTFIINYHTGVTEKINGTLEEAQALAEEGIAYTGESISIYEEDTENLVVRLPWYGVPATDGDKVTADFGDFGFYGEWIEE